MAADDNSVNDLMTSPQSQPYPWLVPPWPESAGTLSEATLVISVYTTFDKSV